MSKRTPAAPPAAAADYAKVIKFVAENWTLIVAIIDLLKQLKAKQSA